MPGAYRSILIALLFTVSIIAYSSPMYALPAKERPPVDVKHLILDHLKDSYHWHLFSTDEKEVGIPLPVGSEQGKGLVLLSFFTSYGK